MRLPDAIRHDLGLKIAALVLALFLWFNVVGRMQIESVVSLPLKYTNMPQGMTFAKEVPMEAKARIRGRGRFIKWKLKDVYFAIDLSPAGSGMVTHVVSPSEVVIPPGKEVEILEVIEPKAIRVELDRLVTRKIPVKAVVEGELNSDKILVGKPHCDPPVVIVAGANKLIGRLKYVQTELVNINQIAKKKQVTARVDLSHLAFVTSDPEEVIVTARIEEKKELGIPSVPLKGLVSGSTRAKLTPDSLDIVISGAASQVDSLEPQDIAILIDLAGLAHGQHVLIPHTRDGKLYFEARRKGRGEEEAGLEIEGVLEAPYVFEVISVSEREIGLVLR